MLDVSIFYGYANMNRADAYNRIIQVYRQFTASKSNAFHYVFQKTDPNDGTNIVETTLGDIARQASMKQATFRSHLKDIFAGYAWDYDGVVDITDFVRAHHAAYQSSLRSKLTPLQRREARINRERAKRGFGPRQSPRMRTKALDIIAALKTKREQGSGSS